MMSVLDQVRGLERQVVSRLRELEPLMREYEQLRGAAQRLGVKYSPRSSKAEAEPPPPARRRAGGRQAAAGATAGPGAGKAATTRATRAATKTGPSRPSPATRQRARRQRAATSPGHRQADVLRLVGEHPGIKVSELGTRLGVDPTGLYRVARRLTEEGRIRKQGAQLYPVETADQSTPAKPEPTPPEPDSTPSASQSKPAASKPAEPRP
jgi:hypothetical protein